jgi:drug/metabolite transporter (DMT)-like permease
VGISFAAIFVRLALPAPPIVTGFWRMLFASTAVGAWLLLSGRMPRLAGRPALLAFAAGACFGSDLALWNTALVETSVATATFLVNVTPVHVGLWSVLALRQPLERRFAVGAALALAGAAVLLGVDWAELRRTEGALLALAGSVFYAAYLLLTKAAREAGDAGPTLFTACVAATVVLAICATVRGDPFVGFPARSWAAISALAVVSQIGGVFGIVWALRYLPATVASVALLAQPVGAALWAWWLFGEALTPLQAVGGLGVLSGIALASQSERARFSRRSGARSTRGRSPACRSRPSS